LLLIVGLTATEGEFPVGMLQQVDSILTSAGFRKEVQSVIQPRRAFSVTYEGPNMEKDRIEELLTPLAEKNQIALSIEVEESVRFP
jgi:hypothetical protein